MTEPNKYNIYKGDKLIYENVTDKQAETLFCARQKVHLSHYARTGKMFRNHYTVQYADGRELEPLIVYPFTEETYAMWKIMNERYGTKEVISNE